MSIPIYGFVKPGGVADLKVTRLVRDSVNVDTVY